MRKSAPVGVFKTRGPVVKLDRSRKARMIERFLEDGFGRAIEDQRILDVGCGNGMISEHFAHKNQVVGVDLKDKREYNQGAYEFVEVDSAKLPFEDACFDFVLSHHVIEHVEQQQVHLEEMHRVLKGDGLAYLGTPNKSSPIMEGHVGNDLVLRYEEMMPLFRSCGFEPILLSLRLVAEPDKYFGELRFGRFLPRVALRRLAGWFPSHYFLLKKA
jgi:ubiquinone/menaquinone biosynthesis C-methylase UbiE